MVLLNALVFTISIYPYFGAVTIASWTSGGATFTLEMRQGLWLLALVVSWSRRFVETAWDMHVKRTAE